MLWVDADEMLTRIMSLFSCYTLYILIRTQSSNRKGSALIYLFLEVTQGGLSTNVKKRQKKIRERGREREREGAVKKMPKTRNV